MKKVLAIFALLAFCGSSHAFMDNQGKTFSLITTNSDSVTYALRGDMEAVYVDVAANKTNVILITDSFGYTNFTKTVSADQYFPVRVPLFDRTGTAIADTYSIYNTVTNGLTGTNPLYGKYPLAGNITIRAAGADNTTGTNSVTVQIIYNKW